MDPMPWRSVADVTVGHATLEEQNVARYRPLPAEEGAPVATAPRVLAPKLTDPVPAGSRKVSADKIELPAGDPWMAAIALLLAAGLGIAVGRGFRR